MNFLLSFLLAMSSLTGSESDGWVSVERPNRPSQEHVGDEDNSSIWVIFSKVMAHESFMVRFPDDPKYVYLLAE